MWEQRGNGRYLYLSRNVGGRVRRLYLGTGPAAEALAALIEQRRLDRVAQAEARRADQQRWLTATAPLQSLAHGADILHKAALLAAGYHRHDLMLHDQFRFH